MATLHVSMIEWVSYFLVAIGIRMIEHLETLVVLSREKTMTKTATSLRLSQSAISKRIAMLESQIGVPLIERKGRRIDLTPAGSHIAHQAAPLLFELKAILKTPATEGVTAVSVGISESIIASWGANALQDVQRELPGVEFVCHAHRSPVVVDRVMSGEYMIGICAGLQQQIPDLVVIDLVLEPMVLISAPRQRGRNTNDELITIEPRSATWQCLAHKARRAGIKPTQTLESFFAVAQMAMSGFGTGLVPLTVARALKVPPSQIKRLPSPGLMRPIAFIARKSNYNKQITGQILEAFRASESLPRTK